LKAGNYPIGMWHYAQDLCILQEKAEECYPELTNEAKLYPKYCCLFKTLGEKRLGKFGKS
jgi:hypothetical protein